MWGNAQGWIFAGIIGLIMGALLGYVTIPPGMTPPTGTLAAAMQPADLPVNPDTVIPPPSGDGDAGAQYAAAAKLWNDHVDQYEALRGNIALAVKNVPDAVTQVVAASDCGQMNLFSNDLDAVINYHNQRPVLEGLQQTGGLLNAMALYCTSDAVRNPKLAEKYATAAFNLGRHLYKERIVYAEWVDGVELMTNAAYVLSKIGNDPDRTQACRDFSPGASDFEKNSTDPVWKVIGGIDQNDLTKYAGDIFQIAKDGSERMWRVEAVLRLGKFKFNAPTRGDQSGARRLLKKLVASPSLSPDPLTHASVHAAALAGADLTIEDYRLIN